jgi:hypothetical protein
MIIVNMSEYVSGVKNFIKYYLENGYIVESEAIGETMVLKVEREGCEVEIKSFLIDIEGVEGVGEVKIQFLTDENSDREIVEKIQKDFIELVKIETNIVN